jgi:hypothetical protein
VPLGVVNDTALVAGGSPGSTDSSPDVELTSGAVDVTGLVLVVVGGVTVVGVVAVGPVVGGVTTGGTTGTGPGTVGGTVGVTPVGATSPVVTVVVGFPDVEPVVGAAEQANADQTEATKIGAKWAERRFTEVL